MRIPRNRVYASAHAQSPIGIRNRNQCTHDAKKRYPRCPRSFVLSASWDTRDFLAIRCRNALGTKRYSRDRRES